MSFLFHFPMLLWRGSHPDLRVSHPFRVGYDSCRGNRGGGAFIPLPDSGFPHLSRWRGYLLILTSCFSEPQGASGREGKRKLLKVPAAGFDHPPSEMQVHPDKAQRGSL